MGSNRYALLVSSWKYQDPNFSCLSAPARDAELLAEVLSNPEIGNFSVRVLNNEPAQNISKEINRFFIGRTQSDLLLLYFSCHGVKDDAGKLYFACTDTDQELLLSTAVDAHGVNEMMRRSNSKSKVLLLDCCYSGAFAKGMMFKAGGNAVGTGDYFKEGRGLEIITASDSMQYSYESEDAKGPGKQSVFTAALIEGLKTGKADDNGDGNITVDDLYNYVYRNIREQNFRQIPTRFSIDVQGEIVVAKNSRPEPKKLPPELQREVESPFPRVRGTIIVDLAELLKSSDKGLALGARQALEKLCDDDSRSVSRRARECLITYDSSKATVKFATSTSLKTQSGLIPPAKYDTEARNKNEKDTVPKPKEAASETESEPHPTVGVITAREKRIRKIMQGVGLGLAIGTVMVIAVILFWRPPAETSSPVDDTVQTILEPPPPSPAVEQTTVLFSSDPQCADVYMDNEHIGKTDQSPLAVSPGMHSLRFVKDGRELTQQMTFSSGRNPSQKVVLPQPPPPLSKKVKIIEKIVPPSPAERVDNRPSDAKVIPKPPSRPTITSNMVWIPEGTFMMGSPESEAESKREEHPQHHVVVSGFYLGRTEVTQAQFEQVMGVNPSRFTGSPHCPVENVNWYDAALFCNALSTREGLDTVYVYSGIKGTPGDGALLADVQILSDRNGYLLPTEAQWEYACRAATTAPFSFGENITSDQVNYNGALPYLNGPAGENRKKTVPVKTLPSNPWGLYEMHGNVSEWCNDWYSYAYYSQGEMRDPPGPAEGSYRVLRGGSWSNLGRIQRSAFRSFKDPSARDDGIGFRLTRGQ
jgi:formylglycine-generating enzyme required for sulfatase activity